MSNTSILRVALLGLTTLLTVAGCDGSSSPSGGGDAGSIPRDAPSAEPECRGEATSCDLFAGRCEDQEGCFTGGDCASSPTPCSLISSPGECGGAAGCDWRDGSCSGTPRSCSAALGEGSCGFQPGCTWVDGCRVTAWRCEFENTEVGCATVSGCRWE